MADGEQASTEEAPAAKGGVQIGKKQVKNEHILIILGVLTLILTYVFLKRSSSGNTASNTTSATPAASTPYASDYSGMADDLNAMQQEIAGLQAYTASSTPVSPTTTNPNAPSSTADLAPVAIGAQTLSNEVQQGAGYWGGSAATSAPIQSSTGQLFDYLPSWAQAQQDIAEDVPVFYQSSPGVFTSATTPSGGLSPTLTQPGLAPTPLYVGNA